LSHQSEGVAQVLLGRCEKNNEHGCSEQFLGLRLKELGIEEKRVVGDGRYWQGLGLRWSFLNSPSGVPLGIPPVPPLWFVGEYTRGDYKRIFLL
jgi:hypothetical protein